MQFFGHPNWIIDIANENKPNLKNKFIEKLIEITFIIIIITINSLICLDCVSYLLMSTIKNRITIVFECQASFTTVDRNKIFDKYK